jgi:hypothetical protein
MKESLTAAMARARYWRSTDRTPSPRFPDHAQPHLAIGPAQHLAGLAGMGAEMHRTGRQGRGWSI